MPNPFDQWEPDSHTKMYPVPRWTDPGDIRMEIKRPLPPDRSTYDADGIMPGLNERQRGNQPAEQAQANPFDQFDTPTQTQPGIGAQIAPH